MSCVSFLSAEHQQALAAAGPRENLTDVLAEHPVPPVTDATVLRIRRLAADPAPGIRSSAAAHRHAPAEVLLALATDPELSVRCAVARNEQSPAELLRRLATDDAVQVRRWVAAHRDAPTDVLDRLAQDADPLVRRVVAWNRAWD